MWGSIITAFSLNGGFEAPPAHRSNGPNMAVLLGLNVVILMGLLLAQPGLWIAGGVGVAAFLAATLRGKEVLGSAAMRRLGVAFAFSAVSAAVLVLVGAYAPNQCAALGPGLFLVAWPIAAFMVALGGRVAAGMGAQEAWPTPEMVVESLGALVMLGLLGVLLLAGSWHCTPMTGAIVAHMAGVTLAATAASGIFERHAAKTAAASVDTKDVEE